MHFDEKDIIEKKFGWGSSSSGGSGGRRRLWVWRARGWCTKVKK